MIQNIPPIPKFMLIHSISYLRPSQVNSGWGEAIVDPSTNIKNVLVTTSRIYNRDATGAYLPKSETTLYYSNRFSIPSSIRFKEGDIITFEESNYRVVSVQEDITGKHHTELKLEIT